MCDTRTCIFCGGPVLHQTRPATIQVESLICTADVDAWYCQKHESSYLEGEGLLQYERQWKLVESALPVHRLLQAAGLVPSKIRLCVGMNSVNFIFGDGKRVGSIAVFEDDPVLVVLLRNIDDTESFYTVTIDQLPEYTQRIQAGLDDQFKASTQYTKE